MCPAPSLTRVASFLAVFMCVSSWTFAQSPKLGPLAERAARSSTGQSSVIIEAVDDADLEAVGSAVEQNGGSKGRVLRILKARRATLPNGAIRALADNPRVRHIWLDRPTVASVERTGGTVGATSIRQSLGYDGSGIGVAVVDSGITVWHDDLSSAAGGQRVAAFVDFVNGRTDPYDDNGHGTHVAGIIAGNGHDSAGARAGIAPGVSLVVLKALNADGAGRISDVIAAFDYILAHRVELNIRVVNVSLSTAVAQSFDTDPLTLAARALVEAGIVVVAAAGNQGVGADGRTIYGGITAPGNAPWVLTVGASSHMGTVDGTDDTMAVFSSRGPTAVDMTAKPDLVAPGVGIESLSDPLSEYYTSKSAYLLDGSEPRSYKPYLALSGTSMASPVVAGSVALALHANPALTPNAVKAVFQYTSQVHPHYNRLTQGVGFLNTRGAVELAAYFHDPSTDAPAANGWSRGLIWGNHLVRGGDLTANANAWEPTSVWGATRTPSGQPIEWGTRAGSGASWSVPCTDATCTSVAWNGSERNVVWGSTCGGDDCTGTWTPTAAGTALASISEDQIVVWGSVEYENPIVVWGSAESQMVVWGSAGEFEIVVWGSNCTACEPVIWSR
jgi:serine protease AprX